MKVLHRHPTQRRCAVLAALAVSLAVGLTAPRVGAQDITGVVGVAVREKTRIEEIAREFIKTSRSTAARYRVGRTYYVEAQASLNAWLDSIALDIRSGKKIDEIDTRIPQLSSAVDRIDKFVDYAASASESGKRRWLMSGFEDVKKVADFVTVFVEMVQQVWDATVNSKDRQRRESLLAELNRSKLKPFGELELEVR